MTASSGRKPRKDAVENTERLIAAAARSGLGRGTPVTMEKIAAEAGVGIGTLYRRYPNREALLEAMSVRAYHLILKEARDALLLGTNGHDCIRRFFEQTFHHRDELVLPLHGAPLTEGTESAALRQQMKETMTAIIARGHGDGSVRLDVHAGVIVRFGAMLAQPMSNVPGWEHAAAEQRENFLRGIAT